MTPQTRQALVKMIQRHEGFRSRAYTDSVGILTIGFGRNIQEKGISLDEGLYLLERDLKDAEQDAWKFFPGYKNLNDARQLVIVEMSFNLGIARLLNFKKMITCLSDTDFKGAAKEMLDSAWASQVGKRAVELAHLMEEGSL